MTPAKLVIALVLNIIVAPGAGQIYLKAKRRGYFFVILAIGLIIALTFHVSLMVRAQLEALLPAADPAKLTAQLTEGLWGRYGSTLRSYVYFLAILYVASLVDAVLVYLGGRGRTSAYTDSNHAKKPP